MKKKHILWIVILLIISVCLYIPVSNFFLSAINDAFGPDAVMQNETQWVCQNAGFEFTVAMEPAPYYGTVLIEEQEYQVELVFHDSTVTIMFGQSEEDVPLYDVTADYIAFPNKITIYNAYTPFDPEVPLTFYSFFDTTFVFIKTPLCE